MNWEDRLYIESNELTDKINKLSSFLDSEEYDKLDPLNRGLLSAQVTAMATYSNILLLRIAELEKEL